MSQTRILAAAAVFIVIMGAYYYYETVITAGRESERLAASEVFSIEPDKVSKVTVERDVNAFTLSKTEGEWRLTEPVNHTADQGSVGRMLDAAKRIERAREIGNPERLEGYGLDEPVVVTFTHEGGDIKSLMIGARNPAGSGYFVITEKSGPVYLVDRQSVAPLTPGVFDVREKRLFTRPSSDIGAVEYHGGGFGFAANRNGGDKWKLASPMEAAADGVRLDNMIGKFTSLKAAGFIEDGAQDLGRYGLDEPETTFTIVYNDGERRSLLVGEKTEGGNRYAAMQGTGTVVRIPGDIMAALPGSVTEVRDMGLVDMAQERVRRITIARSGEKIRLEREGADDGKGEKTWIISEPRRAKADTVAVSGMVYDFVNARAASFASEGGADMAQFGLDSPSLIVTIKGDETRTLMFSPKAGDPARRYYAALDGEGRVAEVEGKVYSALALGYDDLVEKRIFDFPSSDIGRVVVERLGQVFDVEKEGGDYFLRKPEETRITANDWNGFAWRVTGLRYERKITDGQHGEPFIVIRIYDRSGALLESVSIEDRVKGSPYYRAKAGEKGEVYEINEKFVEEELVDALERLALAGAGR